MSNEVRWIRCSGCEGEIGVPPDWVASTAVCPKCGTESIAKPLLQWRPVGPELCLGSEPAAEPVGGLGPGGDPGRMKTIRDSTSRFRSGTVYDSRWMDSASGWAGIVAIVIAFASFMAGGGGTAAGGLIAAALNPLVWISFGMAVYWYRLAPKLGIRCPHCKARNDLPDDPCTVMRCEQCKGIFRDPRTT